ncbi:MAG: PAS domain-containing protein [Pirellulaceae bacterium]|nr:PAS domain-containing protein [Pirellulaceae bacterium]
MEVIKASTEELQQLKNELSKVNVQLLEKNAELSRNNSDIENLLVSMKISALFLDEDLCIRRFTTAIEDLLPCSSSDVGRPIAAMSARFVDHSMVQQCQQVLRSSQHQEREVTLDDGRTFLRRIYHTKPLTMVSAV